MLTSPDLYLQSSKETLDEREKIYGFEWCSRKFSSIPCGCKQDYPSGVCIASSHLPFAFRNILLSGGSRKTLYLPNWPPVVFLPPISGLRLLSYCLRRLLSRNVTLLAGCVWFLDAVADVVLPLSCPRCRYESRTGSCVSTVKLLREEKILSLTLGTSLF